MRRRKTALVLLVCSTLFAVSGNAQCPEKRSLWDRIVYLRDSSKPAFHDQLTELLPYVERIGQCHDRNDSTYTLLLLRVAWLISQEKDYVKAIGVTNQAIGIIHAHAGEPAISQKQLLRGYINLRIYYDSLNQDGLKKEASDSCISVALRLGTGYEYASPLIALRTQDLYESGDYYRCIGYATLGEAMARKNGGTPGDIFFILVWKINSLIELNRYDEAGVLLQKTLAECREKGNKEYLGSIYGMMARISGEKGDKEKAVLYSKQSFSYDERIGNRKGCAESLSNLGLQLYFKKLHQYDVALRCFNKALHYAIAPDSIALFDNIANVYAEKGLYDSAFYYFNRAFAVLGPGMNENKLLEDPRAALVDGTFANYLADMVLNKGDVYLKKYKSTRGKEALRQAITIYATIDRLFDKIRESQTEPSSKLFWRANYRRLYENAIEACYLDNDTRQAFYFFEKSKAILLSDQLSEQRRLDNDEILRRAQVKRRIMVLEKSPAAPAIRATTEADLFAARQELARMERLIKKKYPLYYQGLPDSSLIGLRKLQESLLTGHQAFLELFSGDKAVYTLLTNGQYAVLSRIDKRDFDSTLRLYLTDISDPDLLNDHYDVFTGTAGHLYRLIFGDHPLAAERIIISPDGIFFPFEALVVKDDARNPVYFLEGHAVSYTYSARYLLHDADTSSTRVRGDFLGVAPVRYSGSTGLPALPGSEQSLGRIASGFRNTSNLLSGQATRDNFLRQFYGFTIIQLYTHASDGSVGARGSGGRGMGGSGVGPGSGDSPGTGGPEGGRGDPEIWFADSSLPLAELIPDSKPVTRLIVLSACETGNGRVYEGEGVFSFNRGFAALGIPSSITNLWAVDDQATYRITELFYRYLAGGMPLDKALQKAKTDYIKSSSRERALPYYWAAAILSGDTHAIKFSPPHSLLREVLIILAITGLALLLRWWARRPSP